MEVLLISGLPNEEYLDMLVGKYFDLAIYLGVSDKVVLEDKRINDLRRLFDNYWLGKIRGLYNFGDDFGLECSHMGKIIAASDGDFNLFCACLPRCARTFLSAEIDRQFAPVIQRISYAKESIILGELEGVPPCFGFAHMLNDGYGNSFFNRDYRVIEDIEIIKREETTFVLVPSVSLLKDVDVSGPDGSVMLVSNLTEKVRENLDTAVEKLEKITEAVRPAEIVTSEDIPGFFSTLKIYDDQAWSLSDF